MKFTLVTGRAKSGKTTYIYDEINSNLKNDSSTNLILLVPEQMTYSTELDIIDKLGNNGILDLQILSFKRLQYKIFDEVGGATLQDINDYGKIMLLKQAFDESLNDLFVYKKSSQQDGFLREFNAFVRELKKNSISIDMLEHIDTDKIQSELLKRKLKDIINIYKKIEEKTKDKFFDEEDKTDYFISVIEKSEYIKNSHVWIDNFDSYVGQRYKVIQKLIENAKSVTITLNIDNNCLLELENANDWEIFKTTYDTLTRLKKLSSESDVKMDIVKLTENRIKSDEIKLIEKDMFTLEHNEFLDKPQNVRAFNSMNIYTEVENTARKILALVRDNGYRWKDIAVITGSPEAFHIDVNKVFTQYDIPYFMDMKRDIMDNPFTKYIMSLLDMFMYNFKFEHVFEFMKTGFAGFDYKEVDKLENFCLQYGIEGNRWFKPFTMKDVRTPKFEEMRLKFANDFEQNRKKFKKLKTTSDITMFLYEYFEKHEVQKKIDKKVNEFRSYGLYELSFINAQVWNVIIDIFEQITIAAENVELSPMQYKRILESGLCEIELGIIPPTLDKVTVGGLDRSYVRDYKVIFIIGANEGMLISKPVEKGLLLDEEKEVLDEMGINLVNTSAFTGFKEKHTLYRALTKPTDILYVSYSLSTDDGKALQPSIYIDRLKQLFPGMVIDTDLSHHDEIEFVSSEKASMETLIEKLREFVEGKPIDDIWKDVYKWYASNDKTRYIIDSGINYKNVVEQIQEADIDKIYRDYMTMSVSRLENYSSCPFKFFLDSGLRPQPRKEHKVEFYDIGDIFHKAVEEFTILITNGDIDINAITRDEIEAKMNDCLKKVLNEKVTENDALEANERNRYMKDKIRRLVNRAAQTIIRQLAKGEFRPEYTELVIKNVKENEKIDGSYITSSEIKLDNGKSIFLEGRVDRIDLLKTDDGAYINIIDYKSAKKDVILNDVVNGLQLQLFVYLSSIMKNGESLIQKLPKVGGIFYFGIDDPIVNADETDAYDEEIFKELSLKGYVLNDMEIIKSMDRDIEKNKSSDVIDVKLNKDGGLSKTSKALSEKEYGLFIKKVDSITKELTEQIMRGQIDIMPYKKDKSIPCSYCDYKSVCQFDSSIDGNKYRKIKKIRDTEIISNILLEEGGAENDGEEKDEVDKVAAKSDK